MTRGKRSKNLYEDAATYSYVDISNSINDKITAMKDSADISTNKITMLENRVDVIEEELGKKIRQRKIKITIRG